MIAHPVDSLGNLASKITASTVDKWQRFCALQKQTDLQSQFEPGNLWRCFDGSGDAVLTVISVAGAAAKLASKIPQLVASRNLSKVPAPPKWEARQGSGGGCKGRHEDGGSCAEGTKPSEPNEPLNGAAENERN